MTALVSLLIIITLSLLITRVVTVALTSTGLSHEAALFQAASAFTGTGFTTKEAEKVIDHPVRRRIVLMTMILGNAGIVTAVTSLVLTFVNTGGTIDFLIRLFLLLIGLVVVWMAAVSRQIDRHLSCLINWALQRWTDLDTRDYASLLDLSGEYRVIEIQVQPGDWLANKTLADLALNREGILVLGIYRVTGHYVGAPTGKTIIHPLDTLILYGRAHLLTELDSRRAGATGDLAHKEGIVTQQHFLLEQAKQDRDS